MFVINFFNNFFNKSYLVMFVITPICWIIKSSISITIFYFLITSSTIANKEEEYEPFRLQASGNRGINRSLLEEPRQDWPEPVAYSNPAVDISVIDRVQDGGKDKLHVTTDYYGVWRIVSNINNRQIFYLLL